MKDHLKEKKKEKKRKKLNQMTQYTRIQCGEAIYTHSETVSFIDSLARCL